MKKIIGFVLTLILVSIVVIDRVNSRTSMPAPSKKGSQLVSEEMVLIPAGEFQMGSSGDVPDDETPVHTVYLDAFYMDKYEVTNAQYKEFIDANPEWSKTNIDERFASRPYYLEEWTENMYPSGKGDHPVVEVSWYAAMAYAKWKGKRLPTEAEWEKAARGGLEGQKYPWGNSIDPSKANYDHTEDHIGLGSTVSVGIYPPNGYGLYDMAGNVSEWCLDKYNSLFYEVSPPRNPIAGVGDISHFMNNFTSVRNGDNYYYGDHRSFRVVRGSSYSGLLSNSNRDSERVETTRERIGFRCVRPAASEDYGKPEK